MKTTELQIGDVINTENRRLTVISNGPEGVGVTYFNNVIGPYYTVLPHATVHSQYEHEEIGKRASWWDYHPDVTGAYGEI